MHIRKRRQKRNHVGVNMCEWFMKLIGRKPKKDNDGYIDGGNNE